VEVANIGILSFGKIPSREKLETLFYCWNKTGRRQWKCPLPFRPRGCLSPASSAPNADKLEAQSLSSRWARVETNSFQEETKN
jgi:hypothetical protein